jgi:hypothetical protein
MASVACRSADSPSDALLRPLIAPLSPTGVIGGWSQFKFRLNTRSEFQIAAGTGGRIKRPAAGRRKPIPRHGRLAADAVR